MLHKLSEAAHSAAPVCVDQARAWIVFAAGGKRANDNRDSLIGRAADNLDASPRTLRSIYYGTITDSEHPVMRKLRSAADPLYELGIVASEIERMGQRVRDLGERITRVGPRR